MPLIRGSSRKTISTNINRLISEGEEAKAGRSNSAEEGREGEKMSIDTAKFLYIFGILLIFASIVYGLGVAEGRSREQNGRGKMATDDADRK